MHPMMESEVYGEEVLGKHCSIVFQVGNDLAPFPGCIREYSAKLQKDGNCKRRHFIVFEDGDELWFDLKEAEGGGRLSWEVDGPGPLPVARAAEEPVPDACPSSSGASAASLEERKPAAKSNIAPGTPQNNSRKRMTATVTPEKRKIQRTLSGSDLDLAWLEDMRKWLSEVKHGPLNKVASPDNTKSVMSKVEKLASGIGIRCKRWPHDVFFYKNVKVGLNFDFDKMLQEAKTYEQNYGEDKGHGWLLRHPIKKLKLYQEHLYGDKDG